MPKITVLPKSPPSPALALTDLLPAVSDPGGAPVTTGYTITQLTTLLDTVYLRKSGGQLTGAITFSPDNTLDIGASGATRPRDFFLGRNLTVGGTSRLVGGIVDAGGLLALDVLGVALAVNSVLVTNAVVGVGPTISPVGPGAAISLFLNPKGTGSLITSGSGIRMTSSSGTVFAPFVQLGESGTNKSYLQSPTDGNIALFNSGGTDFSLLQFGGTAATFPALKRSTTTLQVRLANDSAFANLSVLNVLSNLAASFITSSVALTDSAAAALGTLANAPTAGNPTKWIGINDNGTIRQIPAW